MQYFRHNALNPCLESSYAFVEKVLQEVIAIHQVVISIEIDSLKNNCGVFVVVIVKNIQPLRYFNFGGDETPNGAWEMSPACQQFASDAGQESDVFVYVYLILRETV